jgi:chemotaxis protein methyltransferase CheR
MNTQEFDAICRLLREQSGISLEAGKEYLVETRLAPVLHELNLPSIGDLIAQLRSRGGIELSRQIVEALVTNETSFFRDSIPFEELRQSVIPDLMERRRAQRRLNIWCAASSTGQEPYSLALLFREHFPELAGWTVTLLASDISRQSLGRARSALYNQVEATRGLPDSFRTKYFEQQGTNWQLRRSVTRLVNFQEINLAGAWPALPRMDLILVRNVMIYFDVETKKSILSKMTRLLVPDGYLLLGGSETTFNLSDDFVRVGTLKSGFYQLSYARD